MPGDSSRRRSSGRVTLVGAGPGDPDLLTLRGARRLAEADLVLYDALSSDAMRSLAPQARWFYVGKRACRQSIDQDVLNRLMIREAERGFHVVRLKCGDPFVFGRGGEEVLSLARAGVPCEVVPGLSSSVAGPGLLGIPVTHRGASSGFVVVTGHHERIFRPLLESLPVGSLTLVILMGLGQRGAIVEVLQGRGWAARTPAAIVLGAGSPAAWRWTGSLDELGQVALPAESAEAPGILVIGEVVAVAEAWSSLQAQIGDARDVIDGPVAVGADSLPRPELGAKTDAVAASAAASDVSDVSDVRILGSRILPPS